MQAHADLIMAARRKLARDSLSDFACLIDIPTVPLDDDDVDAGGVMKLDALAAHHQLLCDALERVELAARRLEEDDFNPPHGLPIPNLMVLMPPGSAKSTYADVVFAPWFMGRTPKRRRHVILASYGSDLATKQGRRARKLCDSASYRSLLGVGLQPGNKAADEWSLTTGGEFMAGGLLSGLTGNRAHLGILDDPIKGREAAQSKVVRDKVWDAYTDDFCSRLVPGAPQVMILTRWHQDDPAGRILPENWDGQSGWFDGRDGRKWYVICLPAIADREDDPLGRAIGESLWPEWFGAPTGDPMDHWHPAMVNHRTWTSLYQQKPTAESGTYFQREWFHRYKPDDLPKKLRVYATSDHAPGGTDKSDYNVFRVWGVDQHQHLWMLGGHRVQGTIDKAMGVEHSPGGHMKLAAVGALPLIKRHKPLCWFPENDNNWKAVSGFVTNAMRRLGVRCRIEPLTTAGGDKETKAQAFQAKAAMGEVHIPEGPDGDAIIEQYVSFPDGRNDDEVDAGANIGRALDMAHPAIVGFGSRAPRDPYGDDERDGRSDDWITA